MNAFPSVLLPGARRALLAVVLAGVILALPRSGPASTSTVRLGPVIDLSDPDILAACGSNGREKEVSIAVNPTNPKNIVAAWWGGLGKAVVVAVSLDGGKTWQQVVIPGQTVCSGGPYQGAFDEWLSFSPNGTLHLSAECDDSGPPAAILVSRSPDGGLHWSNPTAVFSTTDKNAIPDKDSITADPTDSRFVYATWDPSAAKKGGGPPMFTRSTDAGTTWEAPRVIYNPAPSNGTIGHIINVEPDGTLVDLFTEFQAENGGSKKGALLSLIRSTDRGLTWSSVTRVAPIPGSFVTDPETGTQVISAASPPPLFSVAGDPTNGNLYTVWEDNTFSGGQYSSIAFSMSSDGGFTWSAPIPVNQTPTNIPAGNRQAFLPTVAVAADGTIGVSYYDFRFNDPSPGLPTDYWLVMCQPSSPCTDPASWGNEVRLTDSSFNIQTAFNPFFNQYFLGDYEGLAAVGNDFVAGWTQSIGSDGDSVFFRRVFR
jgi:hypothetical protein